MVYAAASILGGVCVLGLYLGIHGSIDRPYGNEEPAPASISEAAKPTVGAAAAVEAKPMQSDALAASSAPAKVAEAKPKPKPTEEDESDLGPAASDSQAAQPPEPPPLYSPDEPPAQAPANEANAPPY
jgi:hypothetical protein